jgi:hypothetical protein
LVKEMMLSLNYCDRAANQVARSAYTSTALADQRKILDGVLKGIVAVAKSSRISAQAATTMAEHITGRQLPPLPDEPEG